MKLTDEASRHNANQMRRTRHELSVSRVNRQRAVCSFPLIVASVANDMRRILDTHHDAPEVRDTLQYMEDLIRGEYRRLFGREMGD